MDELLRTALRAADAAADVHRRQVGRVRLEEARDKGISDFVTRTDLEAQEAALSVIRDRHPDHEILAEEAEEEGVLPSSGGTARGRLPGDTGPASPLATPPTGGNPRSEGSTPSSSAAAASGEGATDAPGSPTARASAADSWPEGPLWVVDPLDGTTNFMHGHPQYCTSVGLVLDGEPAVGAVVSAATGERWWAARGRGAWKGGRRIRTSPLRDLRSALVGTGFPFKAPEAMEAYREQFGRVLRGTAGIRRGGSAALDLCYLAQGSFDVFWELVLSPWDVAAGLAILSEAGGAACRLEGGAIGPARGTVLAGNSAEMRDALGALVRGEGSPGG